MHQICFVHTIFIGFKIYFWNTRICQCPLHDAVFNIISRCGIMEFFVKDFFSKFEQFRKKLWICSHLLKKIFKGKLHFLCNVRIFQFSVHVHLPQSGFLVEKFLGMNNLKFYTHLTKLFLEGLHCFWRSCNKNATAWKVSKYGVSSGLYFPVFGPNTKIYGVNSRIQSEYRKIRTRKNSVFGHFSRSDEVNK